MNGLKQRDNLSQVHTIFCLCWWS